MTIHESAVRIMSSQERFGEAFYKLFFERCPEALPHFSRSDMRRQALVLTMAVSLLEEHHSNGYPATGSYIQLLGTRHRDRSIPPELYPRWRDAMIETMRGFLGDDWTDALAAQWTAAIDLGAGVMLEGYDQRFAV